MSLLVPDCETCAVLAKNKEKELLPKVTDDTSTTGLFGTVTEQNEDWKLMVEGFWKAYPWVHDQHNPQPVPVKPRHTFFVTRMLDLAFPLKPSFVPPAICGPNRA